MVKEVDLEYDELPERVLDEVDDEAEKEPSGPVVYNISSYGADYTIDGLVTRMKSGAFFVPPFQRSFVWSVRRASRFIESLLLGLPVPGIFVAKESDSARHLIIDGQQRLRTLEFFYEGTFGEKKFKLLDVDARWNNKAFADLSADDRQRLSDSIIHTTVFKQDAPKKDDTSIYHVFERLNTGAVRLRPQEIRNCVYYGDFVDLLNDLNNFEYWRSVFGKRSARFKDQELILRFLAFFRTADEYRRPMKDFLNRFAERYRNPAPEDRDAFKNTFCSTIATVATGLGNRAFRPERSLNAAVFDAVCVGIARRIQVKPITDADALQAAYVALLKDKEFRQSYLHSTADENSVRTRLSLATRIFSDIP